MQRMWANAAARAFCTRKPEASHPSFWGHVPACANPCQASPCNIYIYMPHVNPYYYVYTPYKPLLLGTALTPGAGVQLAGHAAAQGAGPHHRGRARGRHHRGLPAPGQRMDPGELVRVQGLGFRVARVAGITVVSLPLVNEWTQVSWSELGNLLIDQSQVPGRVWPASPL